MHSSCLFYEICQMIPKRIQENCRDMTNMDGEAYIGSAQPAYSITGRDLRYGC